MMWDTETAGADDAGEAAEGVCEFVGIFEAALEELMLGVAWQGGDEFEVEFPHGSGGFDGIEVSVERAEEGIGRESGFGEDEFTGVGGAVVESESEAKFGGGALMVLQTVAEGLQEAFRHEEEGLVTVDRRFEGVGDAVMIFGAVELEEAVVLAVSDVVESGEI